MVKKRFPEDPEERLNRLAGDDLPRHPETEGFQRYAHEEYLGKNSSPGGGGSFRDYSIRDYIRKRNKQARKHLL